MAPMNHNEDRLGPEGDREGLAEELREETNRVNEALGEALLLERTRLRLSQEELAALVGIDKKTVGRIERGERPLTIPYVAQMQKKAGVRSKIFIDIIAKMLGDEST